MNFHNITHDDMNNGDGLRVVLWVAGCEHHCKNCQNPITWDFADGVEFSSIMSGGFEMGNVWYNEPKTLDTAFDVLGDIILATASQQYGGFTVPEVDKILAPYAEKSYKKYCAEYMEIRNQQTFTQDVKDWAMSKV